MGANTVTIANAAVRGAKTLWTETYDSIDVTGNPVLHTRSSGTTKAVLTKIRIDAETVASSNSVWIGDSGTKVIGKLPMLVSSMLLFEHEFKNELSFASSINIDQDNSSRVHVIAEGYDL